MAPVATKEAPSGAGGCACSQAWACLQLPEALHGHQWAVQHSSLPGSSVPSGQSQYPSLTCANGRAADPSRHLNVVDPSL